MEAFRHACNRATNPKTDEPGASAWPSFVTANRAVNRARDESAEERLGHENAVENKCPTTAELDESGEKAAPGTAQPVADEKGERDSRDGGEGEREAGRRRR